MSGQESAKWALSAVRRQRLRFAHLAQMDAHTRPNRKPVHQPLPVLGVCAATSVCDTAKSPSREHGTPEPKVGLGTVEIGRETGCVRDG